jgi:hypothetical protein
MKLSARFYIVCLLVALALTSWTTAQQISAPIVRAASVPKASTGADVRMMMAIAPMRIWNEGDPVIVKDDLKENGQQSPTNSSSKQRDQALPEITAFSQLSAVAAARIPVVTTNFDGIGATGFLPPDTVGAVGPSHYIQMVNTEFAIFDKNGTLLAGPAKISSLWKKFGGPCETTNEGDPVVRYDHLANRWLVSQFALDEHMQCIAISRSNDPVNGGWYLYAFKTQDANGNPVASDYPKIGIWPDGYYMSTQRGFPSAGMDVWVFERDKMLQGQPARQVQFAVNAPSIVLQPSDLNGPPPPNGTPNFFVRPVSGQIFGGGADRIEVFEFSVNWQNPASSTFKNTLTLPTTPFSSSICDGSLGDPCVPQPGTNVTLDTLSVWPMFRAQYRNFGDKEVLLLNHTVDATGHGQAGVRWYELRRAQGASWSVFQQGTHAPDTVHRWMGSMAMDGAGNIAVAYSVSSSQTYPGLRVAMRAESDPSGTLGPEAIIKDGGGSQTHPSARWGDYSSMDVDPTHPCSFWFSSLYYPNTSSAGWSTRIAEVRSPLFSPDCQPQVPNLVGTDVDTAGAILRSQGLVLGSQNTVPNSGTHSHVIVQQSLEPGTPAQRNAHIDVTVQQ